MCLMISNKLKKAQLLRKKNNNIEDIDTSIA